jgi:hypothetical protein
MIICTKFGLCNRIRTVLGYYYLCNLNSKPLKVYWTADYLCNGLFTDFYEPIPNITFINSNKRVTFNFKGQTTFRKPLLTNTDMTNDQICTAEVECYKLIKPKQFIIKTINDFLKEHNLNYNKMVGVHIRRTDHVVVAKSVDMYTPDKEFFNFIEKHKDYKVYLATDNKQTQDMFIEKYGDRIVFYKNIMRSGNKRKTNLEHAVVDIEILSHCKHFQGTAYSSFSRTVNMLRSS